MATAAQKDAYRALLPHANSAAAKLGASAYGPLIWAFWSWETDYGTNASSKANNHAGIKSNSAGKDGVSGQYAAYASIGNFVNDYVRILSLNAHGYPAVVAAMRSGKPYAEVVQLHNVSAWSEADYNVNEIVKRAASVGGTGPVAAGTGPVAAGTGLSVDDLGPDDLKKYAAIGLAAVALIALIR